MSLAPAREKGGRRKEFGAEHVGDAAAQKASSAAPTVASDSIDESKVGLETSADRRQSRQRV
jgi:hypothetical protein